VLDSAFVLYRPVTGQLIYFPRILLDSKLYSKVLKISAIFIYIRPQTLFKSSENLSNLHLYQ